MVICPFRLWLNLSSSPFPLMPLLYSLFTAYHRSGPMYPSQASAATPMVFDFPGMLPNQTEEYYRKIKASKANQDALAKAGKIKNSSGGQLGSINPRAYKETRVCQICKLPQELSINPTRGQPDWHRCRSCPRKADGKHPMRKFPPNPN